MAGCHLVEPSVSGPDDLDGSVWPLAVNIKGSQASSWDTGPKRWGGVVDDCEVTQAAPWGQSGADTGSPSWPLPL